MAARPPLDGTILITGASSGIGRELARQLAGRARVLVLVARRQPRLEALRDEITLRHTGLRVYVEPCDLTNLDDLRAMLGRVEERAGPVDVLVNNAGFGDSALFEGADWNKLAPMIDLNVVAVTALTHALVPGMVARGRGGVLNIGSGFGLTVMPGYAAYAATKHYVTGLSEGLRMELAGTGVAVTHACPGPVRTEFESIAGNPAGRSVPLARDLGGRLRVPGPRRIRARSPDGLPGHRSQVGRDAGLPDSAARAPACLPARRELVAQAVADVPVAARAQGHRRGSRGALVAGCQIAARCDLGSDP